VRRTTSCGSAQGGRHVRWRSKPSLRVRRDHRHARTDGDQEEPGPLRAIARAPFVLIRRSARIVGRLYDAVEVDRCKNGALLRSLRIAMHSNKGGANKGGADGFPPAPVLQNGDVLEKASSNVLGGCADPAVITSRSSHDKFKRTMSDIQEDFSLLPTALADLETRISSRRFARYRRAANNDTQLAFRLYRWNLLISQAFYWPLGLYEIAFRNAVDAAFRTAYGEDWLLYPERVPTMQKYAKSAIKAARRKARDNYGNKLSPLKDTLATDFPFEINGQVQHDWVLSRMNLETWNSLLTDSYALSPWKKYLHVAFPNIPSYVDRAYIYDSAEHVRTLRNRIFHHEPIFHRPLRDDVLRLCQMMEWMCGSTHWLACTRTEIHDLLNKKPIPDER